MRKLLITIFVFTFFNSFSQNGWEEIKNLRNTYSVAKSFSCNLSVVVEFFDKNEEAKTYSGEIYKSGDSYFSSIMGISNLINKKYQITVNTPMNYIEFGSIAKYKPKKQQMDLEVVLDSISKKSCIINLINKTSTEHIYNVTTKNIGLISKFVLTIGMPVYAIKKVVYYYNEGYSEVKKVTIEYKNIVFNKSIPDSYFSEYKYVRITDGKVTPSVAYKGYKIYLK